MLEQAINFLGWNVRGLNDQDRKDTVHETIAASSCHIVCLQETKLESISSFDAAYIGGYKLRGFAERPALGTRGEFSCFGTIPSSKCQTSLPRNSVSPLMCTS
jgi:hypothetical protein